jgi:hypothetical protein
MRTAKSMAGNTKLERYLFAVLLAVFLCLPLAAPASASSLPPASPAKAATSKPKGNRRKGHKGTKRTNPHKKIRR